MARFASSSDATELSCLDAPKARALAVRFDEIPSCADAAPIVSLSSGGAKTNTFFTIGHSTRTIVEFVGLLQESRVDLVVDVRSMPRSRTNPQFNQQGLPEALAPWQIGYEHIAELGGLQETREAQNRHQMPIGGCGAFATMRTMP